MFLGKLSHKEKQIFFDIANLVIRADNILSSEEEILLRQYCEEMDIAYNTTISSGDLNELLRELKSCSAVVQRIMYFELLGLAYSDGHYDNSEKEIMVKLKSVC